MTYRDEPAAAFSNSPTEAVPAIQAEGLCRSFSGTPAVRGIDLTVRPGELFGFLGPNGAGKSTTISMLCTLLLPSSGRAWIYGNDTRAAPEKVRRDIGLISQNSTVDGELTAVENLRLHADLHGIPRREVDARISSVLDLVGLAGVADRLVRTFSGGMRRRLEIAMGLLHRPRVLFLDEPTAGLDPQARAQVWTHLRNARERAGTTLFLTTHYLDEAEQCGRIALINDGRIVAQGSPAELKSVLGADRIDLRTGDDGAAARTLLRRFGLRATELAAGGLRVEIAEGAEFVPTLCRELGVPIYEVTVTRPHLDEVFLRYVDQREPVAEGT